ncbi:mannitol dehydrogenase family protein [Planktothrix sp. FACHB-1355]|uniref:Mannitol-1-phosphate 5-dehydrogenase n=1 Tax=Aerosakkonema funiforme FACHB-1375 TaxID=2949571 RepID=A0A926ZHX8_9CYAN|nr:MULTISPECIES: mannitol dehydrogenase family protein [Oscillatoriales]MBD2183099.1 mannitol dehydrogenase family protein [Aerosakkonema funiforme FACHB-1375]MBD3559537.1 mannitol dehydrogenase family protein [Planktothrix sp. FACHB-1355]
MNSNISTNSAIKLNQASLSRLPNNVQIPKYDRTQITNGIVHIGVGGFHRAHQALYLDNYFHQNPGSEWGICGVGLLEFDKRMRDALQSQDCLYTLVERSLEGDNAKVIGAITKYLFAPDNRQAVIDAMAKPECKIVTLTITEGGYYYIEGSGEFDANHPTIQYDLQHPDEPIGVYGFLTAALDRRRQQGIAPFTVLSCDNLQGNGHIAQKMLTAFAQMRDSDLGNWIAENVAFPNCMVDRITPATTPADIKMVTEQFGIDDAFPVVAEPFLQWVVEDNFCAGRPNWESVGVQMTNDVHPYEMMKIRLLNASHLLIGYFGTLVGYTYVHEAMADPLIRQAVDRLMDEVTPTLQPVPGIDLDNYKKTLIERFANPKIRDQLPRLCLNSSAKIPKFILGSLRDALQQGSSIDYMSLAIAAWFRYLNGKDDRGNSIPIDDPMADTLTQIAISSGSDPQPLLSVSEIFGDLPQSSRFVEAVSDRLRSLYELGAKETLTRF